MTFRQGMILVHRCGSWLQVTPAVAWERDGRSAANSLWVAWASAGIDLAIAGCLEKHGTGTELGDRFELAASAEAFAGATRIGIGIGSVKSNLGQLDTAAGIAGLIKTFLMLEKRVLAATVNVTSPTLNSLTDPLPSSSLA